MLRYQKHIFICTDLREPGRRSCGAHASAEICAYLKKRVASSNDIPRGSVRVNRAGCLGQCAKGPALVVYPEGVWYRYSNESDIDEIFEREIVGNERAPHLLLE